MRPNKHLRKIFAAPLALTLFCVICFALAPFPVSYWTDTLKAPEYIESVWPPPDSQIWWGYYELSLHNKYPFSTVVGVSVVFTPSTEIALAERIPDGSDPPSTELDDRTYLYIDGKQISNEQRTVVDYGVAMLLTIDEPMPDDGWDYLITGTRYTIKWMPDLSTGKHTAKFVAETASGVLFEYQWDFTIR